MNIWKKLFRREEIPEALGQEWCCGFTVHCPHCEAVQLSDRTLALMVGQANGAYTCTNCKKKFRVCIRQKAA